MKTVKKNKKNLFVVFISQRSQKLVSFMFTQCFMYELLKSKCLDFIKLIFYLIFEQS